MAYDTAPPDGPDAPVWLEKEVLRQIITKYDATLIEQDRAPAWAVIVAGVFFASSWMVDSDLTPLQIFDRVRADLQLKQALLAGFRMGALSFDLMRMILDWKEPE